MISKIEQNENIVKRLPVWNRIKMLMEGYDEDIKTNFCIKLPNESDKGYKKRMEYYAQTFINMTNDLLTAPINALFQQPIKTEYKNENSMLSTFSENVAIASENITYIEWLREYVGIDLRAYGNVFTVVDKPKNIVKSKYEERKVGMPYLSRINPEDVLDWQLKDGKLLWFSYQRIYRDIWENPFTQEQPQAEYQQCLWTTTEFQVRKADGTIRNDLSFIHNYGVVPVVFQPAFITRPDDFIGNCTMSSTSNLIWTANNLFNLMVHELYKHGITILLMTDDSFISSNSKTNIDGFVELKKHDNDSVLTYPNDSKEPKYLMMELAVAELKECALFYIQCAIENERDMKSVIKKGNTDMEVQQSGIAKALDKEPLTANLNSFADYLVEYTTKIFDMVSVLLSVENDLSFDFGREFDMKTLDQKFAQLKMALEIKAEKVVPTLYKEMLKLIAPEIVNKPEILDLINSEIEDADFSEGFDEKQITDMVDSFKNKEEIPEEKKKSVDTE